MKWRSGCSTSSPSIFQTLVSDPVDEEDDVVDVVLARLLFEIWCGRGDFFPPDLGARKFGDDLRLLGDEPAVLILSAFILSIVKLSTSSILGDKVMPLLRSFLVMVKMFSGDVGVVMMVSAVLLSTSSSRHLVDSFVVMVLLNLSVLFDVIGRNRNSFTRWTSMKLKSNCIMIRNNGNLLQKLRFH